MSLLGFFTSPDPGSLWWSVLWLAVKFVMLVWGAVFTRPPRLVA